MDWFRVDSGLPQHHKLGRLARTLGSPRAHVGWSLVVLWSWAAKNREDGNLGGLDAEELAEISAWDGDPDAWRAALLRARLIDESDNGDLEIHGWIERQPLLKRRDWRSQKQRVRTTGRARDVHATATRRASTDRQTDKQTDKQKEDCAEPPKKPAASAPPPADSLLEFTTIGNGPCLWHLTRAQVEKWAIAFPGVDVLAEARKALAWLDAHPTRRKTARGMPGMLVRWLTREQNESRGLPTTAAAASAFDRAWKNAK